jgi:hypothetical protein
MTRGNPSFSTDPPDTNPYAAPQIPAALAKSTELELVDRIVGTGIAVGAYYWLHLNQESAPQWIHFLAHPMGWWTVACLVSGVAMFGLVVLRRPFKTSEITKLIWQSMISAGWIFLCVPLVAILAMLVFLAVLHLTS